jgi:colanic acid/amylovoran biosynthesis glycosyltransferase
MSKIKLALIHNKPPFYSETFIRAHIERLDAEVRFYHWSPIGWIIEGKGRLVPRWRHDVYRLYGKLANDNYLHIRKAFLDSFKREGIEAILVEFGFTAAQLLPTIAQSRLPLIVHFHGLDAYAHHILEQYGQTYRAVFQYAKWIVAVSKHMQSQLIALGCPPEKLVLNHYGPHDDFLGVDPTFSEPYLVGVGRFVDKKAPYYTLLAFKELCRTHSEARLLLAGNGALWDTCRNLVTYFGLQNQVELPGVIGRDDYLNALKGARAYVQHSITAQNGDAEGTPVSIIEASAAGVPVIATRHTGIPDVIIHEETGLLVEEHDVQGMARCMAQLYGDVERAREMGRKGKARIRDNFSMGHSIGGLDALIRQTVDGMN